MDAATETAPDAQECMAAAARALACGNLAEARQHWLAARQRPGAPLAAWLLPAAHARPDQSFSLCHQAAARFPDSAQAWHDLARAAERLPKWPDAERARRAHLRLAPACAPCRAGLVAALLGQRRTEDAAAALAEALARLPDDPALLSQRARLAEAQGDLSDAFLRWEAVTARFPDFWPGYLGAIALLMASGDREHADMLLRANAQRLPADPAVLRDVALRAERQRDWAAAYAGWRAVLARDAQDQTAFAGTAVALLMLGRTAEADRLLAVIREKFSYHIDLVCRYAAALCECNRAAAALDLLHEVKSGMAAGQAPIRLHLALGEAAAAAERWDVVAGVVDLLEGHPYDAEVSFTRHRLHNRLLEAQGQGVIPGRPPRAATAPPAAVAELSPKDLMFRFESLGGDHPGCEIGLVQRRFGAEPLGLLRWASTEPPQLLAALEAEFAGVGSAAQTEVYVAQTGRYKTRDRVYGMDSLTFVAADSADVETVRARSLTRLCYLRNKLIEDLRSGEKIFVYRTFTDKLAIEQVQALKRAMARYGANRLLYVKLATREQPAGSFRLCADDLMLGHVGEFNPEPNTSLKADDWFTLFRAVAAAW